MTISNSRTGNAGLTPKGKPMPQTIGEWKYLATLYGLRLETARQENGLLKSQINKLKQKVERLEK